MTCTESCFENGELKDWGTQWWNNRTVMMRLGRGHNGGDERRVKNDQKMEILLGGSRKQLIVVAEEKKKKGGHCCTAGDIWIVSGGGWWRTNLWCNEWQLLYSLWWQAWGLRVKSSPSSLILLDLQECPKTETDYKNISVEMSMECHWDWKLWKMEILRWRQQETIAVTLRWKEILQDSFTMELTIQQQKTSLQQKCTIPQKSQF